MSNSYEKVVDELTQIVNSRHIHHLEKVLEENVQKQENHKVVYKNLVEAREFYSMEHEANPSAQFKVNHYQHDQSNNNVLRAQLSYNNHTYDVTYTFSPAGKIQSIDSVLVQQQ